MVGYYVATRDRKESGAMRAISIIVILVLSGCGSCGSTPPPDPEPVPVPKPTCSDLCAHYRVLGCEEGRPTPNGASCEQWCLVAYEVPGFAGRFPCIIAAKDCDIARECEY